MGLDINGTKFLLYSRARGVSFEETAMIGRQELLVGRRGLEKNLRQFGLDIPTEQIVGMYAGSPPYAEGFIEALGAKEIISFDASAYEGATVIHDLNQPIPDEFKGRFSTVLDGGTLEHIFNFPAAIRSCMEMVREGGHFLAITPTNNHSGHGFYQFSPELFCRIFSEESGFELEQLIAFEETPHSAWYEVSDPKAVKGRVGLVNEYPTMLLVAARKVETVDIFRSVPQQSDYLPLWEGENADGRSTKAKGAAYAAYNMLRIPTAVLRRVKLRLDRRYGVLNRRKHHFKKIDLP